MSLGPIAVVSVSGGKDSTATALTAIDALGVKNCRFVMADTGHEHPMTVEYVTNYLPKALGAPIEIVRADFAADIARKRRYVEEKWPAKLTTGKPGNWVRLGAVEGDDAPASPPDIYSGAVLGGWVWSPAKRPCSDEEAAAIVARALAILHPTGNPYLDLCIWKGRFPSRKAQFCTQELKRYPLDAYMMRLAAETGLSLADLESWQGVRRDESENRKDALDREPVAEGWTVVRPIAAWTAQQVVDFVTGRGVLLNPLYSQGMRRVGCMPCINCRKDELAEIAARFPSEIDRVVEWERIVGQASKRGFSTLLHHSDGEGGDSEHAYNHSNIRTMIEWAKTSRGGKQYDLDHFMPSPACSSVYGLCE